MISIRSNHIFDNWIVLRPVGSQGQGLKSFFWWLERWMTVLCCLVILYAPPSSHGPKYCGKSRSNSKPVERSRFSFDSSHNFELKCNLHVVLAASLFSCLMKNLGLITLQISNDYKTSMFNFHLSLQISKQSNNGLQKSVAKYTLLFLRKLN